MISQKSFDVHTTFKLRTKEKNTKTKTLQLIHSWYREISIEKKSCVSHGSIFMEKAEIFNGTKYMKEKNYILWGPLAKSFKYIHVSKIVDLLFIIISCKILYKICMLWGNLFCVFFSIIYNMGILGVGVVVNEQCHQTEELVRLIKSKPRQTQNWIW